MKFLSLVLAAMFSTASANPTGAGACPAGKAAPGGPHTKGTPGLVGELSAGNYVVSVGGTPVAFDGTPIEVPLDFDIEVTAEGTEFLGILIRVGGATADQVVSSDLTAPAGACGDVGSVTHSDSSPKTVGTASVSLDAATTLDIDISVVMEYTDSVSTFYYSAFQITAIGDSAQAGTGNTAGGEPVVNEETPVEEESPEDQPTEEEKPDKEEEKPEDEEKSEGEEKPEGEDTPEEEETSEGEDASEGEEASEGEDTSKGEGTLTEAETTSMNASDGMVIGGVTASLVGVVALLL